MTLYYPSPCVQMPGPPASVYPETNTMGGAICHSAEGDWTEAYKPTDTMIQRGVSWHFSVFKDGRVQQHYPLTASCWHAGSETWNRNLIGIEHEGTGPLTEAQILASVALVRWIAQERGWTSLARGARLYEHREVNPGTTCPNGRIPWGRYTLLPQPVEARDIGQIAADLVYGVKAGRVDMVEHGPSPARSGWTRLTVDYLP